MPLAKKDYPFSEYEVEKHLSAKQAELVEDVLAVCDRKMALPAFCRKHELSQDDWLSFLDSLDVISLYKPLPPADRQAFAKNLVPLLKDEKAANAVASRLYGYELIQPLLEDAELEDVMVNGTAENVWVYHRQAGICKTNVQFTEKQLKMLLGQIATPGMMDDGRLADGSRVNVIKPPASSFPMVTIRLFRKSPVSLIDLVKRKTLSIDAAAFLWSAFEGLGIYPLNILVIGGTAAGKTSTLNALTSLIPPDERLISIEDTAELNLVGRSNWISLVTSKTASAQDLLRNALRMRPDRLMVGEVRGAEAEVLFTAMNIGHRGSCGTLHANNARDAMLRLENEPMNVPAALLPLADLVVAQHRVYDRRLGLVRRVVQISEVSRSEGMVGLNDVFAWDSEKDALERTDSPSASIEKISNAVMKKPSFVLEKIEDRRKVLEYMVQKDIYKHKDVCAFLQEYYKQEQG
ncbi:CpaF family protein [Candidatus Micrarchaeota archaeon]|nr:CpaF family protein [Candidatus Micrarchaeota archaeon]